MREWLVLPTAPRHPYRIITLKRKLRMKVSGARGRLRQGSHARSHARTCAHRSDLSVTQTWPLRHIFFSFSFWTTLIKLLNLFDGVKLKERFTQSIVRMMACGWGQRLRQKAGVKLREQKAPRAPIQFWLLIAKCFSNVVSNKQMECLLLFFLFI